MNGQTGVIPVERIERAILSIRGEKVMLDSDLAELYGVETRVLNQAVKRNADRFPEDFMFQLTVDEVVKLNRSQIVIGSQKHRDPRFPPYAFTEHGALMLANVLPICRFAGCQPAPCPANQPPPIANRRHSRLPACATYPVFHAFPENRCISEADLLRYWSAGCRS